VYCKSQTERYKRTPEQQVEIIKDIDKSKKWIIEGTYRKSCHCLLDMADTVIFLDTPILLRKFRILKRFVKQQLKIEKCHYKSDFKMLKQMFKWTTEFERDRKNFEKMLQQYQNKVLKLIKNTDLSFIK